MSLTSFLRAPLGRGLAALLLVALALLLDLWQRPPAPAVAQALFPAGAQGVDASLLKPVAEIGRAHV